MLASFEDETSAREAMIGVDDDEVVVLYVDTDTTRIEAPRCLHR